jgi:regulator of nucleoside diphosphate kinase
MPTNPECLLSMQDFGVIEGMLDQDIHDSAFMRLLRQKLANATIVFHDEIAPPVATIGSRVDFTINHQIHDSRVLVADAASGPSRLTLPVTTMRGLALLGLKANDTILIEWSKSERERLRVDRIYPHHHAQKRAEVLAFAPRRGVHVLLAPDDDDPGPSAA